MARRSPRFDRRVRPAENTDVFPAIRDDDYIGEIPFSDAAADAEVTGEIPPLRDVTPEDENAEAEAEPDSPDDRRPELGDRALRIARSAWQRLAYLSAVLLAWLV